MNRRLRTSLVAAVAASALLLAGCGGDDGGSSGADTTAVAGQAAASGEFNDADVTFAQGMIPHHEQAIEMSEIALDPARQAGPEVRALAEQIQGAQDPEIELMRGMLTSWGEEELADMGENHEEHGMKGMASADQMAALEAATGAEFDQLWLAMMIAHHEGALEMARTVQAAGVAPEVQDLAGAVVTGQEAEIATMTGLLGG
jgi:uncharacterized protein (DUF305 family)